MGKTYFSLSRKTDKAGNSEIQMRIYVTKKIRIRTGSGIFVNAKNWSKDNEFIIPSVPGRQRDILLEKQTELKSLTAHMDRIISDLPDKNLVDREYIVQSIRNFRKSAREKKDHGKHFFDITEEYLLKSKLSLQRRKNFQVLKRALMRFELYKRKTDISRYKLNISTLSPDTLREIENFLANEKQAFLDYPDIYQKIPYSPKETVRSPRNKSEPGMTVEGKRGSTVMPKERGQNSVADMLTRMRTFYIWANAHGYTTNNPFKNFNIGEIVYGTPIYISNEERKRLYSTDMSDNPALATQRDIFVFQCLIGCRVSDLLKMTSSNVIDDCIEYIPRKTKDGRVTTVRVPLNPTALEILERYRDKKRKSLLPFHSTQQYNVQIKEAFKRAGLDRMVTTIDQRTRQEVQQPLFKVASSHMARRSFIGNIYKQVKDPNLVGALSGHKEGSKAFARYRTIDDEIKKELVGYLDYDVLPGKNLSFDRKPLIYNMCVNCSYAVKHGKANK